MNDPTQTLHRHPVRIDPDQRQDIIEHYLLLLCRVFPEHTGMRQLASTINKDTMTICLRDNHKGPCDPQLCQRFILSPFDFMSMDAWDLLINYHQDTHHYVQLTRRTAMIWVADLIQRTTILFEYLYQLCNRFDSSPEEVDELSQLVCTKVPDVIRVLTEQWSSCYDSLSLFIVKHAPIFREQQRMQENLREVVNLHRHIVLNACQLLTRTLGAMRTHSYAYFAGPILDLTITKMLNFLAQESRTEKTREIVLNFATKVLKASASVLVHAQLRQLSDLDPAELSLLSTKLSS